MKKIFFLLTFVILFFQALLYPQYLRNQTIVKAEYFINSDPGEGNGINITGNFNVAEVTITVSNISIPIGSRLYVRFKSSNGKWSAPRAIRVKSYFEITGADLVYGEYFINTDPGQGNGTQVTIQSNGNIDLTNLNLKRGDKVYFRLRDSFNRWGPARAVTYNFNEIATAQYYIKPFSGSQTPVYDMNVNPSDDSSSIYTAYKDNIQFTELDTVYVRVQTTDGFLTGWKKSPLTIVPVAPQLSTPLNNICTPTLTPVMNWNKTLFTLSFRIQISNSSSFQNNIINIGGLNNNQYTVPAGNFSNNSTYYWRVNLNTAGGTSLWSEVRQFKTLLLPVTPSLTSPVNGTTKLPLNITLIWNPADNAENYQLQVSNNQNFSNTIIDSTGITNTSFDLPVNILHYNSVYYWRVKAINCSGESQFSSIYSFSTLNTPASVNLIYPPYNSINQPVNMTFMWNTAVDRIASNRLNNDGDVKIKHKEIKNSHLKDEKLLLANQYWFELTKDSVSLTDLIRDTTLVDTAKTVSDLSNLTTYYWRVRGKNEVGWGLFSNWSEFTTIIATPETFLLASPANNTTGITLPLILKWYKSERAEAYKLAIATDSLFNNIAWEDSAVNDTSIQIDTLNPNTLFYWRIRAKNAGGESQWSDVWNFRTEPTTSVKEIEIPKDYELSQNYPNPFNPSTTIKYSIPKTSFVTLKVYNILGREEKTLVNEEKSVGYYQVEFNGSELSSGVYFYQLQAGDFLETKKMILIK